jgi:hypothetical protein
LFDSELSMDSIETASLFLSIIRYRLEAAGVRPCGTSFGP